MEGNKVIDLNRKSKWAIAAKKAELQERRKQRIKEEREAEMQSVNGIIGLMFTSPLWFVLISILMA